jgi:tetratricopeptide (TPR) repeat protein
LGRIRQVAIVLLTVFLVARPASAAPPSPEDKVKAREHYQKGLTHYDIKEYPEALAEFKNAYRVVQDPAFLFNIAQCYRKLGQNVEALDYYHNYMRRFPSAPNRGEVERRIQEIEREMESKPNPSSPPLNPAPPLTAPKPDTRPNGTITPISPPPPSGPPAITQPPPSSTPMIAATAQPGEGDAPPIYKRWWFWTGVGAVVAGAVITGVAIATRGQVGDCRGLDPCRTLGD